MQHLQIYIQLQVRHIVVSDGIEIPKMRRVDCSHVTPVFHRRFTGSLYFVNFFECQVGFPVERSRFGISVCTVGPIELRRGMSRQIIFHFRVKISSVKFGYFFRMSEWICRKIFVPYYSVGRKYFQITEQIIGEIVKSIIRRLKLRT